MTHKALRFSQLSPARQALVRACQAVNFGEIQGVLVRDAEPVFGEPAPVVVIDVKLDKADEPRRSRNSLISIFAMKSAGS
jgi:hypothetical protein